MKKRSLYGATGIIASATFLSRILGLLREQVFAYFFGAGMYTDAFQIAFRIPNLLRDLFAEGAMSSALVPVYTKARKEKGEKYAWRMASNAIFWLALVLGCISLLGIFFADSLVSIYAPAFKSIEGKHELTVGLTRILWPFLPLVVMAAIWMGLLNARDCYATPALAPSVFNIASILAAFFICPMMMPLFGLHPIYGMAFGAVLGGLGQWLVQWPALRGEGFQLQGKIRFRDPELKRIVMLMGAGTFGLAATQINILINSVMASGEGDGAVSWLNYAFRLMQFPIGVFGVAISTATLTKVSKEVAANDMEKVRTTVVSSLRMVLALTIPSAVGLAIMGVPIISVIYEHGKFHAGDTYATAVALAFYAIGLSAYSAIKVLVPVFYSLGKSRVAILSSGLSVIVNVGLCVLLVQYWGFKGLAFAASIAAIANCLVLLIMIEVYAKKIDFMSLFKCLLICGGASLLMGLFLSLGLKLAGIPVFQPISEQSLWFHASFFKRVLFLCLALGAGVVTYISCAKVLGLQEINDLLSLCKKRFKDS